MLSIKKDEQSEVEEQKQLNERNLWSTADGSRPHIKRHDSNKALHNG